MIEHKYNKIKKQIKKIKNENDKTVKLVDSTVWHCSVQALHS